MSRRALAALLSVAVLASPAWAGPGVSVRVVVAGRAEDPRTGRLHRAALDAARGDTAVALYDPATSDPAVLPASVAAMVRQAATDGRPSAYVCTAAACSLPQTDPAGLREVIERFARGR